MILIKNDLLKNNMALLSRLIKAGLLLLMAGVMVACNEPIAKQTKGKTFVVKPEKISKQLYFSGTINPLKESSITNPMDAVIESMPYHYGQQLKKGDVVFVLNSSELQKRYNEVLTDYLKSKDAYVVARAKFIGTQDLWDSGLISKNNYISEKSSLNNARVGLIQAKRKLMEIVDKMGDGVDADLPSLSLSMFDKVQSALSKKHDHIYIRAPRDGVLLYPPKSGEETGRLSVGASIKAGQVMALIGDMKGARIEIEIPEVDIDKVQPGMKANVRTVAFSSEVLQGKLVAINAQATPSNGGNLPSFSAIVEVQHLTDTEKKWLKVGMSATVELIAEAPPQLVIPIAAVHLSHGKSVVCIREKNGQIKEISITTGAALEDKVAVSSGLKPGDVVVYG